MSQIKYNLIDRTEPVVLKENLGFGNHFTDHVFEMDYTPEKGWHNAIITRLDKLEFHHATTFMHYGQTIFEGLKAYYTPNGEIQLFRPEKNMERLNKSAKRLCMPEVDIAFTVEALKELVAIEKDWVPKNHLDSLYVRPFMIGTDSLLGVKPSSAYKFIILLSPVGAYYPEGFKPIKIMIQEEYVRAVRKGLGECKTAANYASSLLGAEIARKMGYTQCLWLDAVELKYIEEVGTMNIFIRFNNEIVTPALTGGILHGITRLSTIQLLKDMGYNLVERLISVDELVSRYEKGEVLEVFGTGTAAVISSVGEIKFRDNILKLTKDNQPGELATKLFDELSGIQRGTIPDRHNWIQKVDVEVTA